MTLKLNAYISDIESIKRATFKGHAINAKPFLLLSILSCIQQKLFQCNKIVLNKDLICIYKSISFLYLKRGYVLTPIHKPFYYLESDGFWHLKWKDKKIDPQSLSLKFIYDNIDYAYFDEDLWILLQENDAREKIKEVLIKMITND